MPAVWKLRFLALLLSFFALGFFGFQRFHSDHVPLSDASVDATLQPSPILIVSAFFPLSKSKHTMSEYEGWLCQFLGRITTDIYFYTPQEMVPLVRKCRGHLPITIDTTFATPFDIPPLRDFKEEYEGQLALDRERKIHSVPLYATWNGKPFWLDEAVKTMTRKGRSYEYAFWNDAGSFRSTHNYTDWPAVARVREIWEEGSRLSEQKEEDLLFYPICRVPHPNLKSWSEEMGPIDGYLSEASFFGGSPKTVAWWRNTYYAYHDHYLRQGLFVGKDQNLIHSLMMLFPSRFIGVWLDDPEAPAHKALVPLQVNNPTEGFLGTCGENWFYYQFWFASATARESMNRIWESAARWSWGGWRQRHECRSTRVVWIKDLLQRQFGQDWRPPVSSIVH
ncbi:hypothetical protein FB45DRAFT_293180 [Roridomyces roridus]|uniref:Uncharacterized protein n=1 Tax=Roridomyces roridus TaxID=1738132 RepID=A0AAD7FUW9_9AGAR|nr:hypothetical protein FB45DRAFT_293180 [Roridomyces roridus]